MPSTLKSQTCLVSKPAQATPPWFTPPRASLRHIDMPPIPEGLIANPKDKAAADKPSTPSSSPPSSRASTPSSAIASSTPP